MASGSPDDMGTQVRKARILRAMSQEQLAVRAGVTRNTVARLERGAKVQAGSRALILRVLDLDESPLASSLSDDEVRREVERRWPGRIGEILSGSTEPPPPRPHDDRPGQTGQTA
jgi:transcriptional regulator with XRE-family HTH domain